MVTIFSHINGLFVSGDQMSFLRIPIESNHKFRLVKDQWKYISDLNAGARNQPQL